MAGPGFHVTNPCSRILYPLVLNLGVLVLYIDQETLIRLGLITQCIRREAIAREKDPEMLLVPRAKYPHGLLVIHKQYDLFL